MAFIVWLLAIGSLIFGLARAGWSLFTWTLITGWRSYCSFTLFGFVSVISGILIWVLFIFSGIAEFHQPSHQIHKQTNAWLYTKGVATVVRY